MRWESSKAASACLTPGGAVGALLAATVLLPVSILLMSGLEREDLAVGTSYVLRVLTFTLVQAALSTVISIACAIPVALALHRRRFFGRGFILRLFAVTLGIPQLVAVLGLLSLYGKQGMANAMLSWFGLPPLPAIYGLGGILLAHAFFNMPFAARLLLSALDSVPPENWRVAASLGFGSRERFRRIEWPFLRAALPGIAFLVFMLCATSFTIVLTLGGGPQNSTLEVAIYQALRFDFDPPTAARLAGLQILVCGTAFVAATRVSKEIPLAARTAPRRAGIQLATGPALAVVDAALLALAALFVLLPLLMVVLDGVAGDLSRLLHEAELWRAVWTSLAVSLCAGLAATAGAALMASAVARGSGMCAAGLDSAGRLVLLVPPVIVTAGWFLLLHRYLDPSRFAPLAVVAINAVMALPFVMPLLVPAVRQSFETHDRLAASLGMRGWGRFRLADWPVLKRPLGLALLVGMLVSVGDFGAVAFFGSEGFVTLPLMLYQRLGSYRVADAAGLALVLLALCLLLSAFIDRAARPEGSHAG